MKSATTATKTNGVRWWQESTQKPFTNRPVTSLGHQWGRRVFWEWHNFFKLCPVLSNYVQHIFPGRAKIFLGGLRPPRSPGYGPVHTVRHVYLTTMTVLLMWQTQHFILTVSSPEGPIATSKKIPCHFVMHSIKKHHIVCTFNRKTRKVVRILLPEV